MRSLFLLLLLSCLFYACSPTAQDCVCTMEFRYITVSVLDNNGNRIDSLATKVTNKQSGKVYSFGPDSADYFGNYIVMTDQYVRDFNTSPTSILFEAGNRNFKVSTMFSIIADECKCHVSKISGPDTITVISN